MIERTGAAAHVVHPCAAAKVTALARVHRRDEHHIGGIRQGLQAARDGHAPILERLAHHLEDVLSELGELVEEEDDAVVAELLGVTAHDAEARVQVEKLPLRLRVCLEPGLHERAEEYGKSVITLPKHLDEKVARLHLEKVGAKLTKMSKDQADYISVTPDGPYKPDAYRY